ncbi:MAG: oligopeptide transporter, OPT family [Bryobacterales bacterium]|nr:oligopeptide transporter, OPT family [Bryobacterales bacterium]
MEQSRPPVEFTVRAVLIGLLIGTVLTAANTYLGLYAGMTVSGSIPAAIVSMGILRGLLRRGTVHENNIVQTVASAGEAVAAGIIFTVPAMVITGVWDGFPFWEVSLIGLLGGLLGVLFMIPLRRSLIVEEKGLVYPEGVACAKVLQAGEVGGGPMRAVVASLGSGLAFKALVGLIGVFRGTAEYAWAVGRTVVYAGTDVSLALVGVGVIVGLEISAACLGGGVIAWLFAIPVYLWQHAMPGAEPIDAAWEVWSGQVRYMGVGAMIVGGLSSIWKIRGGIATAMRRLGRGLNHGKQTIRRTDRDLPNSVAGTVFLVAAAGTFVLYNSVTGSPWVALAAGSAMLAASFFFVAVSSYICGLVGSSNNPISGMTICALLFSSGILLILGMSGTSGMLGALGVASIVCCAAATAGDTSQDLKTGHIVGATPRLQQFGQFAGILAPVFSIAPVLALLHRAYGIGTDGPDALLAPQATLFASIVEGLFSSAQIPWGMVVSGALVALGIVVLDGYLERSGSRFRAHVMPVAVGIYLPLAVMVPVFLGGLVAEALRRRSARGGQGGLLIASGLIAGEAVAGILIAIPRTMFADIQLPVPVLDSLPVSLAALAVATVLIYHFAARLFRSGS